MADLKVPYEVAKVKVKTPSSLTVAGRKNRRGKTGAEKQASEARRQASAAQPLPDGHGSEKQARKNRREKQTSGARRQASARNRSLTVTARKERGSERKVRS